MRRIVVSGSGEASAKPDTAEVEVRISFIKPRVSEAQESVETLTSRLLHELDTLGLPRTNVETASYVLYPHYEWEKHSSMFRGYQASHTLRISTDNLRLVGLIIEAAAKVGVREVGHVTFKYRDRAALEKEALRRATINAVEKAHAIAEGLGVKVGSVIRISTKESDHRSLSHNNAPPAP